MPSGRKRSDHIERAGRRGNAGHLAATGRIEADRAERKHIIDHRRNFTAALKLFG
jgi:hypothetical protein